MNLLVHFVIYGHSWCFESSQIALAYGSCNFENFQNITRAHKSRNALAFIRFPILITQARGAYWEHIGQMFWQYGRSTAKKKYWQIFSQYGTEHSWLKRYLLHDWDYPKISIVILRDHSTQYWTGIGAIWLVDFSSRVGIVSSVIKVQIRRPRNHKPSVFSV